jgi:hypothetical protein
MCDQDDAENDVILDVSSAGKVITKSQHTDYTYHGSALSAYNLIDFFVDTYDGDIQYPDDGEEPDESAPMTPGAGRGH